MFKQRNKASQEVPSSSMADIAFLLIIFFMVTTVFSSQKGIDFGLPKEEKSNEYEPKEAVHIVVEASGRILVDQNPLNASDIQSYILPKLAVNPTKPVILQTDQDASYGDMVQVLDQLKLADVKNIALPTREDIASWGSQ